MNDMQRLDKQVSRRRGHQAEMAAERRERAEARATPRFWTMDEVAVQLRLSPRSLYELRNHPLYAPDGSRVMAGRGDRKLPLWSDELVQLIAAARTELMPGVRMFTDDEALEIRKRMKEKMRQKYLAMMD